MKKIKLSKKLIGATLALGVSTLSASALLVPQIDTDATVLGITELNSSSVLANADHKCGEGKCGAAKKAADHKCGAAKKDAEHKCGAAKKDAEHKCGAAKKDAEHKCGAAKH